MIHILKGDNFSGRSHYLKTHTFYEPENIKSTEVGYYLGIHPANYITGLFSTCEFEIKLHNKNNLIIHKLDDLVECTNFKKLFKRNPFTLSGGEQVLLSIISGLNMEAYNFAIDSTLEQLSQNWRQIILNTFESDDKTNYLIADNRDDEFITGKNYKIVHSINTEVIKNPIKIEGINFNEYIRNIYSNKPMHVSIKNIKFVYDKDIVLNNLSIDLEPGKIYHLSGANGAGKSTFSKILTGILKPNTGSINVDGKEIFPYYTPGRYFGYSFQNPDDQIFENSIFREINPQAKAIPNSLSQMTIASTFGLADILNYHPSSLPFPIRKAVSLAGTLAVERPWYIFDEPTVGLDNRNVGELIKIFKTLSEIGKGIIVISHSENFPKSLECIKLKLSNGIITS